MLAEEQCLCKAELNSHKSAVSSKHFHLNITNLLKTVALVYLLGPRDEACIFLVQDTKERQEYAAYAVQDKTQKQHAPVVWMLLWVELCY